MNEPLHIRNLNRARDWYNPLRGLNVARVISLLEEGERGKFDELQKLNRMAEKRHPTLRALKERWIAALKKLDWDIKIPSKLPRGVTAAQADTQAAFLRERYEAIENLPQSFAAIVVAKFRGFSHLELRHHDDDPSLPVTRLVEVPQWHMVKDQENFDLWRYDPEARGNVTGSVLIDPASFIIREVDNPLCDIALLCFLRRNFAKTNWTAFQQDYALASIFATLGENTPSDKVKEWMELVKAVTNNSRGVLPPGSVVTPLELGNLDGVQFANYIAAEDADLVLAGTSGLLTMLTANTGLGDKSQGDNHQEAFDTLALGEAMEISAIFQAQFDKPGLAADFPSQRPVAYFQLAAEATENLDGLADRLAKLKTAGFVGLAQELSEKFGLTLEAAPAATVVSPGMPGAPAGDGPPHQNRIPGKMPAPVKAGRQEMFLADSEQQLAAADLVVLAPVITAVQPIRTELARLADVTDDAAFTAGMEALKPSLVALRAQLPALGKQVLTDRPDLEETFASIIGTAFRSGVEEAAAARQTVAKKGAKPA